MRIAYLGPAGTFTEDALHAALNQAEGFTALPTATVHEAIVAVERGAADRALVPFENSIEGSVRATLDALAFEATGVTIVGEQDYAVEPVLLARPGSGIEEIEAVLSHPQPLAQCARFLREQLPEAELRPVSSSSEAVRLVVESSAAWGALGTRSAATLYRAEVLREGISDVSDNVTRFVWIAPEGTPPGAGRRWKTSLVFSELGEDHPGALVEALLEFSRREVNLTRIESRPLRQGLGRYMFFVDLDGALDDQPVADAIDGLRAKAESVRILGSYPLGD